MTLTTNVIHDMWDTEYHALHDHLSSTGVRKLLPPSTPAHFKHWRDNPRTTSTDAFDLGHVVHRLVLGKGAEYFAMDPQVHGLKKDGTVADSPKATAGWKAAEAEARERGQIPFHINDLTKAEKMAAAVFADPVGNALFAKGDAEVSIFANDPITGVKLRARIDWLDDTSFVDFKTTANGAPGEFDRAAAKFGYHIQEAFYRHVAECAGLTVDRFVFVAVETTGAHLVSIHEWDEISRVEAKRLVRQAIDTYARCMELNTWPGYAAETNYMSLPIWMLDDQMIEV